MDGADLHEAISADKEGYQAISSTIERVGIENIKAARHSKLPTGTVAVEDSQKVGAGSPERNAAAARA